MSRVLVICPAGLREKWQAELLNRFDEQFQLMFKKEVKQDVGLYAADAGPHAAERDRQPRDVPRRGRSRTLLDEAGVTYDLVIIDEAHHLRTTGTLSNASASGCRRSAEHLLLLTATPLQTSQARPLQPAAVPRPGPVHALDDFVLQLEPNVAAERGDLSDLRHQPPGSRQRQGCAPPDRTRLKPVRRSPTTRPTRLVMRAPRPTRARPRVARPPATRHRLAERHLVDLHPDRQARRVGRGQANGPCHQRAVTEEEAVFLEAVLRPCDERRLDATVGDRAGRRASPASCVNVRPPPASPRCASTSRSRSARGAEGTVPTLLHVEESSPDLEATSAATTSEFDVSESEAAPR